MFCVDYIKRTREEGPSHRLTALVPARSLLCVLSTLHSLPLPWRTANDIVDPEEKFCCLGSRGYNGPLKLVAFNHSQLPHICYPSSWRHQVETGTRHTAVDL